MKRSTLLKSACTVCIAYPLIVLLLHVFFNTESLRIDSLDLVQFVAVLVFSFFQGIVLGGLWSLIIGLPLLVTIDRYRIPRGYAILGALLSTIIVVYALLWFVLSKLSDTLVNEGVSSFYFLCMSGLISLIGAFSITSSRRKI